MPLSALSAGAGGPSAGAGAGAGADASEAVAASFVPAAREMHAGCVLHVRAAALEDTMGAAAAGTVVSVWKRGAGEEVDVVGGATEAEAEAKADATPDPAPRVPVLFIHGGRVEGGDISDEAFLLRLGVCARQHCRWPCVTAAATTHLADTLQWSAPIKSPCAACAHGCVALDAETPLLLGGWNGAAVLHEHPYALHAGSLPPPRPRARARARFTCPPPRPGSASSVPARSHVGVDRRRPHTARAIPSLRVRHVPCAPPRRG